MCSAHYPQQITARGLSLRVCSGGCTWKCCFLSHMSSFLAIVTVIARTHGNPVCRPLGSNCSVFCSVGFGVKGVYKGDFNGLTKNVADFPFLVSCSSACHTFWVSSGNETGDSGQEESVPGLCRHRHGHGGKPAADPF